MMHLGRIQTGVEDSEIQPGDIVRLLQPLIPELYGFQEYAFGIVVGVVRDGSSKSNFHASWDSKQTALGHQPGLDGLVVYLYEPDSSTIYVDPFGAKALFSFDSDEVELYKAIHTPASQ